MATLIDEISQKDFDNWDGRDELAIVGPDVMGIAEIAEMFKVSKQVIVTWRDRKDDFPKPYITLKMGALYHRKQIKAWGKKHDKL